MLNPSVLIGSIGAGIFALGMGALVALGAPPESQRSLDVTQMRVVGQGCGDAEQRKRVFIAVEEDDLPGPSCEVVFTLYDREAV